jgi:hypothetical protein
VTAGGRSAKPHVHWLGRFGGVKAGREFSARQGRLVKVRCRGWVLCKINRYVVESGWLRLCNAFAMFTILAKAEIAHCCSSDVVMLGTCGANARSLEALLHLVSSE